MSTFRLILPLLFSSVSAFGHVISEDPGKAPVVGGVEHLDPDLASRLDSDAKLQLLAQGFDWAEGPVWDAPGERLIFSDVPENTAYSWSAAGGVAVFLHPSGYTGRLDGVYQDRGEGSNGLTLDAENRLLLCQPGDRRIARLNADGRTFSTIAARYNGGRFNSPNDLVRDRQGNVFFTDPPYGLPAAAIREQPVNGVYRVSPGGQVTLIDGDMSRPNGIGLSPDERTLYVASSDDAEPWIIAIPCDGLGNRAGKDRVFFEASGLKSAGHRGGFDGLKVDADGYLWVAGYGGVFILDPAGNHIGTLHTERGTANVAFGGNDGRTFFVTADDVLLMIRTKTTWTGRGW